MGSRRFVSDRRLVVPGPRVGRADSDRRAHPRRRTSVSRSPDCRRTSWTGSTPERRSSRASRRRKRASDRCSTTSPAPTATTSPPIGGGSAILETRFGTTAADGTFDPLTQFGGSLIQSRGSARPADLRLPRRDRSAGSHDHGAPPHDAALRPRPRRRGPRHDLLRDRGRGGAQPGRDRGDGQCRDEHLDRTERGRQVRLEGPEPERSSSSPATRT